MSDLIPEWEALGIPVDDSAEPEDADLDEESVHEEDDS